MHAGKRVINIDESSMSQGLFVRQSWASRGSKNTYSTKPYGQRLSLIAAMDTLGQVYFAVSQSTVDSEVFKAFMLRLAAILDCEDPDWRNNSIFVVDNASYHRSDDSLEAFRVLNIPVMAAGPYGYDASPCEKLFAHLKVGDLNPAEIASGKR